MSVTYVGSLTLGQALPSITGVLATAYTDLAARVAALQGFSPKVIPPDFNLKLAGDILAGVQLAIAAGITPPSISLQLGLVKALLLEVKLQLDGVLKIQTAMGEPGIHVYAYTGRADALGGEFSTELAGGFPGGAGGGDLSSALVLGTNSGLAWNAMATVFKVTP
jgi:hypothetical protein